MAKLTTSNFNGKASRNTIEFDYSVDLKPLETNINIDSSLTVWEIQEKEVASKFTVSGVDYATVGDDLSGSVTGTYTRVAGSDGPTKHTVEFTCYYNVMQRMRKEVVEYEWQPVGLPFFDGTVSTANYRDAYFPDDGTEGYVLIGDSTPQSDGSYAVYKQLYEKKAKYSWSDWTDWSISPKSVTQTVGTYYKSPAKFDFMNCERGKQWRVDAGIDSLIENINSFSAYATQWKAWKYQLNPSSCPRFNSPLSANNLNSIYAYIGQSGNFNPGDPISADMFNNLAKAIN